MTDYHRDFVRLPFVIPVRVKKMPQGQYYNGFTDNISEGGIKFVTNNDLDDSAHYLVRFDLLYKDLSKCSIECESTVCWQKEKEPQISEYGLSFLNLGKEDWKKIRQLIEEIQMK